jgi:Carboxypeptidase regulatory-like domain
MAPSGRCRVIAVVLTWILAVLLAGAAYAQVRTTGQVVGTARDASGAVIAGADIELRDLDTAITATARSAQDGGFVFPALQPGRYLLTAVAKGFQPFVIDNLVVETARAVNVQVRFEVAGVLEEVQVSGQATVIETSSTTISTTVNSAQIQKLRWAAAARWCSRC